MRNFIIGICLLISLTGCSPLRSVPKDLVVSPRGHHSKVVNHHNYSLAYSKRRHTPNWVSWQLTCDEVLNKNVGRSNNFAGDPTVRTRHRVESANYRGTGYDRGHMAPAGDMRFSQQAMEECFYMTNMCPQLHDFNAGCWAALEDTCRKWACSENEIYIVCGPVFKDKRHFERLNDKSERAKRVAIPDGFFKVVLSLREGHEKAIGFVYQHNGQYQSLRQAACSVDEVERLTGLDFFSWLPNEMEKQLESKCSLPDWIKDMRKK